MRRLAPADVETLLAFDRAHVWHPYSSALTPQAPYVVESAHGIRLRLRDRDGEPREVVDAMSSWWCAIHGYAVPQLDAAAHRQGQQWVVERKLRQSKRTGEAEPLSLEIASRDCCFG